MTRRAGRHFLQIPGPTNVPDRVLRAIDFPTIDHRGPDFAAIGKECLAGMKRVFKSTQGEVVIYPASGTGAWEAALVNTLSPGDRVLMAETGHFATLWRKLAERLSLTVDFLPGDWRRGADASEIEARLAADTGHAIRAVCVVHNETSTGAATRIPQVRGALDRTRHPALLMVDTISSLASMDYRHDEWGVDVTVGGSQKGLMLPPGLSFNAISAKALVAAGRAKLPRSYWDWREMLAPNATGFFPYTPATTLLRGLRASVDMLLAEGLDNVFARHRRLADGARYGVAAWGLKLCAKEPKWHSDTVTAICVPTGFNSDDVVKTAYHRYRLSLGVGLSKVAGRVFRIGHIGNINEIMILQALAGCEMALRDVGVPVAAGSGVAAAQEHFRETAPRMELSKVA